MSTFDLTIIICSTMAGLVIGGLFGALPWKQEQLSDRQQRMQQMTGFIGLCGVLALILTRQDAASWALIIAMIAGVGLVRIPPLYAWIIKRFPVCRPTSKKHKSRTTKKGKTGKR
ncbi:hypothetical protein BACT_0964 [Bifidobacterium actinocoloniiforme DSM 22766]|uniref:Uncharacterized protein n=1 Tax=Bifidobacterium actinocoloniiforme DSM 22766 TaxID=1437605 RepID=A0A086Z162_9BIFI|nr:hypothetical protein [Bifidobacterium actinocoloniiforme]AKV55429.1 hypothetical protein AB656_03430 [Bifidobacterium actinocoloniiforme DSM 22766]KFI40262.1 hypothetical protein BACT_0964 [Bifidobacterium actinocoloniiforme DSM 22766]